jgi:hypothetical protein
MGSEGETLVVIEDDHHISDPDISSALVTGV